MTEAVSISATNATAVRLGRWWQLSLGVICMSMIANLQYGWTLFVNPIHDAHGWSLPTIQLAFSIFVLVETWLPMLYAGAVVGGIGAGAVYGACVGNALKWFPDRRGFAAGITAMGFGAGSALTVFPIANM